MRFLPKDKISKTILVISDLHLGAGEIVGTRHNYLEDFFYDKELSDFLSYYSNDDYKSREVELIINGDFFDLLAVPFVEYFDDEFWSEKAAIDKLKLIFEAHREALDALVEFAGKPKKKVTYIIGNHDAEFLFESLQKMFMELFPENIRKNVSIHLTEDGEYLPLKGIVVKHGHQYEHGCDFSQSTSIVTDEKKGEKYFIPPWGSYFVTRIINKFKKDRPYIHSVRPIRKFLTYGLLYDTFFTLRFLVANLYYFFMVRFIYYFKQSKNLNKVIKNLGDEMRLMKDYETLAEEYFEQNQDKKVLILGHTHIPLNKTFVDGSMLINSGTWTKMFHMDFGRQSEDLAPTYIQLDICNPKKQFFKEDELCRDNISVSLLAWKGRNQLPFHEV